MNFVCQLRLWLVSNSNPCDPYSSLSEMHFLLFVYFSAICLHFSLLSVVFGCPFPFPPSEIPQLNRSKVIGNVKHDVNANDSEAAKRTEERAKHDLSIHNSCQYLLHTGKNKVDAPDEE